MKHLVMLGFMLLGLNACTPADEQYCRSFGVAGTSEFGKCLDYFHQQEAIFGADRAACEFDADGIYPPTLYDNGHYEHVMGGFGPYGEYYGGSTIRVEPDYYHNAEVDRLRMRVIEPCMQARGWNSGSSWQAGRHAVAKTRPAPVSKPSTQMNPKGSGLPWRSRKTAQMDPNGGGLPWFTPQ